MKWNNWDVADDGLLSRDGVSAWPVYTSDGHLCGEFVSYYLVDRERNLVEAKKVGAPWLVTR